MRVGNICLYSIIMNVQGLFVPFACLGSGDPVRALRLYTTNTLDTIEAFFAETYIQLVTTEAMCCSTSWSALTTTTRATCVTDFALFCAAPYIVACVDVSRTVFSGPFKCILNFYLCFMSHKLLTVIGAGVCSFC